MKKLYLGAVFGLLIYLGCTSDTLDNILDIQLRNRLSQIAPTGELDYFVLPESDDYENIPQDPFNPLNKYKAELGKFLFFETGLALAPVHESGRETYSCGSCHIPTAGFMPGRIQGIADGGLQFGVKGEMRIQNPIYGETEMDIQTIRPLSMLNLAFVTNSTWNGRFGATHANEGTEYAWVGELEVNKHGFQGLESQNIEGLRIHRMVVNKDVTDSLGYTPLFDAAFPDFPESDRYNPTTASFALSAYLRTLLTNQAPFQQWLKGDQLAMSEQEKRGAMVFYGKAQCYTCHKGPALNATEFYALGVKDLYETGAFNTSPDDPSNLGRGGFTQREEDAYKFKVPQLYNLHDGTHFFHGSSMASMEQVVQYFNRGVPENPNVPLEQIAPNFRPLNMTTQEKLDLVAFLERSLYDPNVKRYVPEFVLSGNCFPNNDPVSQDDLGCD